MMRAWLQHLPRPAVYAALIVALCVPYVWTWRLPVFVSDATRGVYETLERVHRETPQRPVFVMSSWGPGTQGENRPQLAAVVRHLLRLRQPFVVFSVALDPLTPQMSEAVLREELARAQARAASNGVPWELQYGVHYANLGFKGLAAPTAAPLIQALDNNLPGLIVNDYYGTPVGQLPVLNGVRSLADCSMIICIGAGTEGEDVLGVFTPQHSDIPVAIGTMALVCTRLYPYFDARQVAGLLDGLNGAMEYFALLDPAAGSTQRGNAMTMARLFIIALLVIGNAGMLYRRARGTAAGTAHQTPAPLPTPAASQRKWPQRVAIAGCVVFAAALVSELAWIWRHGGAWTWERAGAWTAAFCTLGMLSFALGDNVVYRVLEHVIIGSAAAYGLYAISNDVLLPSFIQNVARGGAHYAWLLVLIPSALWFTVYSRRWAWTNKLVVGLLMGVTAGITFQKFISMNIPQVLESFKPLVYADEHGWRITGANLANAVYVLTMLTVLYYFIFCFRRTTASARAVDRMARLLMMTAFGAMFGNTVATRLSWLIDRLDELAAWITGMPFWK